MTCHHTDAGPMLNTHHTDCTSADCGGCVPCPEHHCTARTRCHTHIASTELVCPNCIGNTRQDIAHITTLAALMPTEAQHRGINSQAANLAGPAADPNTWSARQILRRRAIYDLLPPDAWEYATKILIEDDDTQHPLLVLGRWEVMLREDWGPDTDQRLTITSAADYLTRNLPRLANDPHQDFPLFAAEIRSCRAHLEAVLHDSRQPEKGAPCPTCSTTNERGPALVKRYDDEDHTGASDTWTCPKHHDHTWTEADYRHRVATNYLQHADRLTADQIHHTYRIPPGTLRRWASEKRVTRRGKDNSGRQLYDVQDALTQRDQVIP